MSRHLKSSFLEDEVRLLVQHFGAESLRSALAKVSGNGSVEPSSSKHPTRSVRLKGQSAASIASMLENCRHTDIEKYNLLTDFYMRLKNRKILPESQDIIHFSQLVGLKDIRGKSRKDMIPRLMRFLLGQATEALRIAIERSADISEQQRQQGFSVLTDKLLGRR